MKSLLEDPENGSIDSSLAPSMLLTLEQVRSTLQDQLDTIKNGNKSSESSIKEAQQGEHLNPRNTPHTKKNQKKK